MFEIRYSPIKLIFALRPLCFLLRVIQGCLKLDIHLLSLVEGIQTLVWAHIIKF